MYKIECIYKCGNYMFVSNLSQDRLDFFLDNLVLDRNVLKVIVSREEI
ncbi:MAG: hypothetical protein UR43_C0005G0005 [candidate division TM6 bacterium GW2011_GWF2_33_332]|nr:MAG: hypothetical protein UR43_C0005G0005 [candidate division TM6 bacterium GW2011_GWF2_33_332]